MAGTSSVGSVLTFLGLGLTFCGITLMATAILERESAFLANAEPAAFPRREEPKPVATPHHQPSEALPQKPTEEKTASVSPTQPRVLYREEPQYSAEARQAKYSGTVHVSAIVGIDGHLTDIEILDSPGLGLDEKILACLERW